MATIFSLIAAIILWITSSSIDGHVLPILQIVSGAVFIFLITLEQSVMLIPFNRAEDKLSPRLLETARKDFLWNLANVLMILFALFSFIASVAFKEFFYFLFLIWVVFLGISLDCLWITFRRMSQFLNPFAIINLFSAKSRQFIKTGQNSDFCLWIDALAEIAVKAIHRSSTVLCEMTIKQLESLSCDYLKGKGIGKNSEEDEETIYTLSYILQRFQLINTQAVEARLESVASLVIVAIGKIVLNTAKYAPTISSLPLHFFGEFVAHAQEKKLAEVAIKASITLQEVAKNILLEDGIMKMEIKDIFIPIIGRLEAIAKTTFRQDKTLNIDLLTQPFHDLKKTWTSEKFSPHPNSAIIVRDLDRILGEFDALGMILRTIPNIPGYSDKQDTETALPPETQK